MFVWCQTCGNLRNVAFNVNLLTTYNVLCSVTFSNSVISSKIYGRHFHHHHLDKISLIIHHVAGRAIRWNVRVLLPTSPTPQPRVTVVIPVAEPSLFFPMSFLYLPIPIILWGTSPDKGETYLGGSKHCPFPPHHLSTTSAKVRWERSYVIVRRTQTTLFIVTNLVERTSWTLLI